MAITYLILVNQPNSLTTRWVEAYLKNNGNPDVRQAGVQIALDAPLSSIDLQAAWDAGVVVPNGAALWNQLELQGTDDLGRSAIAAFLDVVRANGTLAQMIAALEGVIDDDPKQLTAYNRITTALNGGSAADQRRFMAAMAVLTYSRLAHKDKS